MAEGPVYSLIIGAAEPRTRAGLERIVGDHPHFHCVASMPNAVFAMEAVERRAVAAVLLVDESPGLRGRDVLADLGCLSPHTKVIITTIDRAGLAGFTNVAAVIDDRDFGGVDDALTTLAAWFDEPIDDAVDQRSRPDRRERQDWTKVFAERRNGARRDG